MIKQVLAKAHQIVIVSEHCDGRELIWLHLVLLYPDRRVGAFTFYAYSVQFHHERGSFRHVG